MLTEKELQVRRRTIGSSDVPAICGLSPWKTEADVIREKLGQRADQDNPSFALGHKLERPIAELAMERIGAQILMGGWTVTREWMSATPDFFGLRDGSYTYRKGRPLKEEHAYLIEVKCVGWKQLTKWAWGKVVPDYVLGQVQWQMGVLGYQEAYVAALLGGSAPVEVYRVERDDAWLASLKDQCFAFWKKYLEKPKTEKAWAAAKLAELSYLKRAA